MGFPGGSDGKASACNVGDVGSIPGLGRSPGGGNGNPLQYSCLENPMDRGVRQTTLHGVGRDRATSLLSRVEIGLGVERRLLFLSFILSLLYYFL